MTQLDTASLETMPVLAYHARLYADAVAETDEATSAHRELAEALSLAMVESTDLTATERLGSHTAGWATMTALLQASPMATERLRADVLAAWGREQAVVVTDVITRKRGILDDEPAPEPTSPAADTFLDAVWTSRNPTDVRAAWNDYAAHYLGTPAPTDLGWLADTLDLELYTAAEWMLVLDQSEAAARAYKRQLYTAAAQSPAGAGLNDAATQAVAMTAVGGWATYIDPLRTDVAIVSGLSETDVAAAVAVVAALDGSFVGPWTTSEADGVSR